MPESGTTNPDRTGPSRSRRRQHGRTAIEVVVFVTVFFFMGWGVDALARMGAEGLLARNIQRATGVSEPPDVDVRGFAFVPQVIRGSYRSATVTTRGITSGPLRIERVSSQLSDVRVPFHDVLVQDIRRVGISRSTENVTLRLEDLNAYLKATGRPVRLAPADNGELEVTGAVDVLDQRVRIRAVVTLGAADQTLRLIPREIDTGTATLNRASRLLLDQRLALSVPLGTLPFGHQMTNATVVGDTIELQAQGVGIVVQP